MAEVKWIKLSVDIFNDQKISIIRGMPDGNNILLVWIYLLVLAGKCNNLGYIHIAEDLPYTDETLSAVMGMPLNTIRLALDTFHRLKMIGLDNSGILILNWEKHQNIEGLERIREQTRKRVREHRERRRLKALEACNVTETLRNDIEEIRDREEEGDKDIDIEKTPPTPYQEIKELFNSYCPSYSKVISIGATRERHLRARWKQFDHALSAFKDAFEQLEASDFCKGKNDRGWRASFDWLIQNDLNMAKVLEGKYDNRLKVVQGGGSTWEERNPDAKDDPFFKRRRVRDAVGG